MGSRSNAIVVAILFLSFATVGANAGPFGLEMGMTLEQIESLTGVKPVSLDNSTYNISVPKPHSMFEQYVARISPTLGLYWIKAVGHDISTSGYGSEVRSAFNDLRRSLETTYGPSKIYDVLLPKSIWDEPGDWMMGFVVKERYLIASWTKEDGAKLPDYIKDIAIGVSVKSKTMGWVGLDYSFSNMDEAEAQAKAAESSVF